MSRGTPRSAGPADPLRGAGRTADVLRRLLTEDLAYRRRWRAHVVRAVESDPHQGALAHVIAQHLWDSGEVPESETDLPRKLKDVVARALTGRGVSHQSLDWFIRSFEMTAPHQEELWKALEQDLSAEVHTAGPLRLTRTTARPAVSPTEARLRASYRTRSLIETYTIGPDRCRRSHHLVHVLEALGTLDRVTYRFDTTDLVVTVPRGGKPTDLAPDATPGRHALEVILTEPLAPGQLTAVETRADYPPGGQAANSFDRSLRATAGGVSLRVQFDPESLPTAVRWWSRAGQSPELSVQSVELDDQLGVHRFLAPTQECVVGFEWDW